MVSPPEVDETGRQDYRIALLCCGAALGSLIPIALFQLEILKKLPDPPGSIFDSKRIVTSKDAFPIGVPDGLLGLGSYGATLLLLFVAAKTGGTTSPVVQISLKGKLLLDSSMAAWNTLKQVRRFRRICSWCMGTAIATGAMSYFGWKS